MRPINVRTLQLESFVGKPPPYAILSHTWAAEEVTLDDMQSIDGSSPPQNPGWQKIRRTCQEAHKDDLGYAWVDTCCIDKSSSAELSESINSMFRWYREAAVCYAFLEDVDVDSLHESRWFTRAWTLQELLAPEEVIFYNKHWQKFSTKVDLAHEISAITGIDEEILYDAQSLRYIHDVSIAKRMSWAASRDATREEDVAYSLLGLFDVSIPLLYGEGGSKAFVRLQEEIIKKSLDQSFLTWIDSALPTTQVEHGASFLASHPRYFRQCVDVKSTGENVPPFAVNNSGLQMRVPLYNVHRNIYVAALPCYLEAETIQRIGIVLEFLGDDPSHCRRIETERFHIVSEDEFRSARVRDCCILRSPAGQRRIQYLSIRTLDRSVTRGDTMYLTPSHSWRYHPVQQRLIEITSVWEAGEQIRPKAFAVAITTSSSPLRSKPKVLVRIDIDNGGARPSSAYSASLSLLPLVDKYHRKDVNLSALSLLPPDSTASTKHNFASLDSKHCGSVHAFISWETMANRDVLTLTIGEGSRDVEGAMIRRWIICLSRLRDGPAILLSPLALTALIANALSYHTYVTSVQTAAPVARIYLLIWLSHSPARKSACKFTLWAFARYVLGVSAAVIAFQDGWIVRFVFQSAHNTLWQIAVVLFLSFNCYHCASIVRYYLEVTESSFLT